MKKIISKINQLGLSTRKEFSILGAVLLLCLLGIIMSFILLKKLIISVFFLGFAVVFSILYLNRYDAKISEIRRQNINEFVNLFSYFKVYIHNGYNVYSALKEIASFANLQLASLLYKLISDIDENKTVQPFIDFASNFDDVIVEEMMISIFQMVDDGEQSEYLKQFDLLFDKFSELIYKKQLESKNKKLGSICSTSLIASCYLIIVLTIGIINILGDVRFFDGAGKLAENLKNILEKNGSINQGEGSIEFIDSQMSEIKKERFFNILKRYQKIRF